MNENLNDYVRDMLLESGDAPSAQQPSSPTAPIGPKLPGDVPAVTAPSLMNAAQSLQEKLQAAQQLPDQPEALTTPADRYVSFELAGQCYGLPIVQVKEVLPMPDVTPVPGAPENCPGVVNMRGDIVTVIDLRSVLGLPSQNCDVLIVLNDGMALCVDAIGSIIDAQQENSAAPPNVGAARPFIGGLSRHQGRFILLVDIQMLENSLFSASSSRRSQHQTGT
tara:strand:+ start:481 stop:1146 length:666 start_codon:yes stop_codon:yes gene_type:complete